MTQAPAGVHPDALARIVHEGSSNLQHCQQQVASSGVAAGGAQFNPQQLVDVIMDKTSGETGDPDKRERTPRRSQSQVKDSQEGVMG